MVLELKKKETKRVKELYKKEAILKVFKDSMNLGCYLGDD